MFRPVARFRSRTAHRPSRRRGLTLLELLVAIVVVGVLALVAVPVFRSALDGTNEGVVEQSAAAIAREANAMAPFNSGADVYQTSEQNIDDAINAAALSAGDGWAVDTSENSIALTTAGKTTTMYVCLDGGAPQRAAAQAESCGPTTTAPGAPLITSITAGDTTLQVAFVAPGSNGGSVITDYEYALDGGSWVSAGTTNSPFTITGLVNDQAYTVTVRAVNAVGAGPASAGASGTPSAPGWIQLGADIDGEAALDQSGYPVSMSADGSVLAISAYYNGANGYQSGHVRVYEWNGTAWVQRGADIDGEAAGDLSSFWSALSPDGSVVVIGAYGNDANGSNAGHVRVYAWDGTAWVQRGADINGEAAGDWSGRSVSTTTTGNVVAIGAPYNDGTGIDAGHVRVYEWNGASWAQRGADIDGEAAGDSFGESVSLSTDGSVLAVGAPLAGYVRFYEWNGASWVQRGADIDGEAAGDSFGWKVATSATGNVVAVGGPYNDGNGYQSGHVRVYAWDGTAWVQRGADIDGEAAEDWSGWAVSLSVDGGILAVGARANDGNGNLAGHVRVYEWNGTAWVQRGADLDGEAAGDVSGIAVSLSADGTSVAIGAPYNSGNGTRSGHVRVYEWR